MKGLMYHRLAGRVFNTPLMIEPGKLQIISKVVSPRLGLDPDDLDIWQPKAVLYDRDDEPQTKMQLIGSVAVIPIHGTLVHRSGFMDAMSGLMSYQTIAANLVEAMENPAVTSVLFDVSSPGGEVAGCFDLTDMIYGFRGKKPMVAISNEACYSAAYCVSSAADMLVMTRTAGVGSIGVYAQHIDMSKMDEMMGITVTPIFAGARKNDGSPHEPLSDEAFAVVQAEVNRKYDLFVDTVARNREIAPAVVRSTEAGLFFGEAAVQLGLSDQITTFDEVVETLLAGANIPNILGTKMKFFSKMGNMTAKTENTPACNDIDEEDMKDVVENETDEDEEDEMEADGSSDEAPAAASADPSEVARLAIEANCAAQLPELLSKSRTLDEVKEILNVSGKIRQLCKLAKMPDTQAEAFIKEGLTVVQVQEKLIETLAERSERFDVSTKPEAHKVDNDLKVAAQGASALLLQDAERRKKEHDTKLNAHRSR